MRIGILGQVDAGSVVQALFGECDQPGTHAQVEPVDVAQTAHDGALDAAQPAGFAVTRRARRLPDRSTFRGRVLGSAAMPAPATRRATKPAVPTTQGDGTPLS